MRIPSSVFAVARYALVLGVIAGSVALLSADKKAVYSRHEKAYYADPSVIEYVQPGLVFSVVSATIAQDGTISVDYKITDPTGAPLDLAGVVTPGIVAPRFGMGYMAKGNTWFTSYWQSTSTNATTGFVSTHPSGDSGGTTKTVAVGEYIYTFNSKAPGGFDPTVTHRIIIYGSRNLTTWDLGTSYADTWYDFVPNGAKVSLTRDIVRTQSCNKCHDSLAFHGGARRSVQVCVVCHQPQNTDSNGNSADFKVMIHQIHMGSQLPSVQAGTPYQLGSTDWSSVMLPSDPRRCQFCHESTTGATQASNWETNPNRAACGSCHNDVNFASGKNHAGGLPQANDTQCAQCHLPKDGGEFDASIEGAHVIPENSVQVPGVNVVLQKVTSGNAGQKPTITFTVKDNSGNPIPMSTMATGSLSFTMAGPTTDYGNTNFGSDVTTPGYVTESAAKTSSCGADGTCTYTFTHPVPAGAKGTFAIGVEARLSATLQQGTVNQQSVSYATPNQVIYFSVDGTPVSKRRTVVATANCNSCHAKLELHGSLRNNTEYCVMCHNPGNTDSSMRPSATNAADKAAPAQGINFAMMIHKVHTGTNLEVNFNQDYVIVGYGGSHNSFGATYASVPATVTNTGVRFPAMSPTGNPHDTTNCALCHVNASESNLPVGLNNVTDPQGLITSAPATTSACTACHLNVSAFAHASMNTDPKFGESCSVCHGAGAAYDPAVVHAGQ